MRARQEELDQAHGRLPDDAVRPQALLHVDFCFKPPKFEQLVHCVVDICEPVLRKAFVTTPTMSDHRGDGKVFTNYPYALYAVDVKFQPALRPSGRFEEARRYFSNMYGFKVEASVGPYGEVVFFINHTAGAVSDITILSNHVDKHRELMRKSANESLLDDHGEGAADYQDSWALLADKGYQGAASMLRAVHPKKKPRNGELTADDVTRNTRRRGEVPVDGRGEKGPASGDAAGVSAPPRCSLER